jgi:hypothetical protein
VSGGEGGKRNGLAALRRVVRTAQYVGAAVGAVGAEVGVAEVGTRVDGAAVGATVHTAHAAVLHSLPSTQPHCLAEHSASLQKQIPLVWSHSATSEGEQPKPKDGASVGSAVGFFVGAALGAVLGRAVGLVVGASLGLGVGVRVGARDGAEVQALQPEAPIPLQL